MPLAGWTPPTTMAEARERRRSLISKIEDIETQLGDRRKRVAMGSDWEDWYQRTKWARVARLKELRELKGWMHDHRECQPV